MVNKLNLSDDNIRIYHRMFLTLLGSNNSMTISNIDVAQESALLFLHSIIDSLKNGETTVENVVSALNESFELNTYNKSLIAKHRKWLEDDNTFFNEAHEK
jgi:hypothetical protein